MITLLVRKEVIKITKLSKSTIHLFLSKGDSDFPKPINTGERRVAWVDSEIQEWILRRMAERDNGAA